MIILTFPILLRLARSLRDAGVNQRTRRLTLQALLLGASTYFIETKAEQ